MMTFPEDTIGQENETETDEDHVEFVVDEPDEETEGMTPLLGPDAYSPALRDAALRRIIALKKSTQAEWAGGEFLGLAVAAAAGIGKSGIPTDAARRERFVRIPGALRTIAAEAANGGDANGYFQRALSEVTTGEWTRACPEELMNVLRTFYLPVLDGQSMMTFTPDEKKSRSDALDEEASPCFRRDYASQALGRMVASNRDLCDALMSGEDLKAYFGEDSAAIFHTSALAGRR
mmetsp:Transcript_10232/g.25707  ORF Transcript_10232/g.25707 Transcript_10232/m.25707 type:complete len:234 (+) Transcript_10232:268-969(+)